MAEIPEEMMTNGREPDQHFEDSEQLFRRCKPGHVDGVKPSLAAISLPDMSVNREKYGPAEWLLLHDDFEDWGVFRFKVGDIPQSLTHSGTIEYTFAPSHEPLRRNYPHSEVQASCEGVHVERANQELLLDPDAHLRWRQLLLWECWIEIYPEGKE